MSPSDQPRAFDAMLNDLATMPLMDAGMMGGFYAELRADLVSADITDDELADMTARIIEALRRGGQFFTNDLRTAHFEAIEQHFTRRDFNVTIDGDHISVQLRT